MQYSLENWETQEWRDVTEENNDKEKRALESITSKVLNEEKQALRTFKGSVSEDQKEKADRKKKSQMLSYLKNLCTHQMEGDKEYESYQWLQWLSEFYIFPWNDLKFFRIQLHQVSLSFMAIKLCLPW